MHWDFTKVSDTMTDTEVVILLAVISVIMIGGAVLGGWLSARDRLKNGTRHYSKRYRPGRNWGRRRR
jgi:hypothetical protein